MTYSVTPSASGTSIKQDGVEVANINASGEWSFKDAGVIKTLTAIASQGSIGSGQVWQDLTASRAHNTTYTNTTGKPIAFFVTVQTGGTDTYGGVTLTVNGVVVGSNTATSRGSVITGGAMAIVPAGATYSSSGATLNRWTELR